MKDRLANRVDKRVFIKSDARAKYGSVVDVVDNVRSAGVDDVGLLTEQKKTGPSATTPAPRRVRAGLAIGVLYGNGSWRVRRRAHSGHERDAAD